VSASPSSAPGRLGRRRRHALVALPLDAQHGLHLRSRGGRGKRRKVGTQFEAVQGTRRRRRTTHGRHPFGTAAKWAAALQLATHAKTAVMAGTERRRGRGKAREAGGSAEPPLLEQAGPVGCPYLGVARKRLLARQAGEHGGGGGELLCTVHGGIACGRRKPRGGGEGMCVGSAERQADQEGGS
jgi:hypothetical protein